MKRFTIWQSGRIVGTFPGATEAEALNAFAKDEGKPSFEKMNEELELTRDDYSVKEVRDVKDVREERQVK